MLQRWLSFVFLISIFAMPLVWADSVGSAPSIRYAVPQVGSVGYVAEIKLHTPAEVEQMLRRAELYVENLDQYPNFEPIKIILHGPELRVFDRKNYQEYKDLVGLAARLEAFNVIDVQVCEVRMLQDGIQMSDLPSFIEPVPFGPAEEKRLLKRGYQYF